MTYGIGDFPGPLDSEQQFLDEATRTGNVASDVIDQGANFKPEPSMPVRVVFNTTAIKTSAGNEAYQFKVQESFDGVNYVDTGLAVTLTEVGNVEKIVGISRRYLRLLPVITGTLPSITLSSWLLPA